MSPGARLAEADEGTGQRILKQVQDAGLVRPMGKGPANRYSVVRTPVSTYPANVSIFARILDISQQYVHAVDISRYP
jgi:hypothetical protein